MIAFAGHACIIGKDMPPGHGGVARYYTAAAQSLGAQACARVPVRHWLLEIPALWLQAHRHGASRIMTGEVLPWGTVAWGVRHLGGPPYAVIVHGLDLLRALGVPRKRFVLRRVLRGAHRVIANSAYTASLARGAGARDASLRVVHPPVGISPAFAEGAQVPDVRAREGLARSRVVLTVSRLVARKGTDDLLRAMVAVQARYPLAAIVVIGDGPERIRLEALARTLRLHARFLGACDDQTVAAWYRACDIFALTPKRATADDGEGFGIVLLEAGAFGKPVVGTRSGGVEEAIEDGTTGYTVAPEHADAIAAALRTLLDDASLRERLGSAGKAHAASSMLPAWGERLRSALA